MKNEIGFIAICTAIIANLIWGSTFVASKVVLAQCPPVTAVLIRFLIAVGLFTSIAVARRTNFQLQVIKSRFRALVGLGLVGYSGLYVFQMTALKHIASSQSAAIMLLAPVFTLMIESILRKEIRSREATVIGLGFVGAISILLEQYKVEFSGIGFHGLMLTVGASFCLGASVIQTKRLLAPSREKPGFTVLNLTFLSLLIGSIGLLPVAIIEQTNTGFRIPSSPDFWLWSTYLGVVCSVGAFLLWNWSIKHISPVAAAIAMYLKTPVALGFGAVLLSEHLTLIFYAGTILILGTLFSNHLTLVWDKK